MNATLIFGHELLGKGYRVRNDLIIGWTIIGLCYIQLVFGAGNLYIFKKINIFHNAFGFLCAARTIFEMMSSLLHISYSGPVTLTQPTSFTPILGLVVGAFGYYLSGMSCSLHVLISLNRLVSVYFIFQYKILFSMKNFLPCNMLGFSAKHYGYVVIGCEDGRQPSFNVGTIFNYLCWVSFCTGAIVVDLCTFVKILKLKKMKHQDNDKMFKRNVRFFAQSAFQNIPMFIDIALLSLGDNSLREDKALFRIVSFSLTRFTDLINSMTLIFFNPEARKYIVKIIKEQKLVSFTDSSVGPLHNGVGAARSNVQA
ncbi:hypothetical protein QR680_015535 [Steinernema hermaphroditum]|uniref:7TM GPCR serpentine receptor class x (Srx) domain-containing protein n=1 Tax=Steinernema hermaphroditum TaxID=289476 RepID=A0AA39HAN5_9BILA|nr:hypothetical protein QR680_015535 [Steinernema hermaphroditum]